MSDPQRPWFDAQHPATDSQRPWIEEPMSDDLAALKAKARLKHNNRGRCYPRRRCFECREVYPCLTIRLLDESDQLGRALHDAQLVRYVAEADADRLASAYQHLRFVLREILHQRGIATNPLWEDDEIVAAIRELEPAR